MNDLLGSKKLLQFLCVYININHSTSTIGMLARYLIISSNIYYALSNYAPVCVSATRTAMNVNVSSVMATINS